MYPKQEKDEVMEPYNHHHDDGHDGDDDEDLHAEGETGLAGMAVVQPNPSSTAFDAMGTTAQADREIWQEQNFLEVNDSSIFYNDQFPHLPDFPCMSSSSSSSSTPALTKPIAASSSASSASSSTSSAASWAVMKTDNHPEDKEDDFEGNKTKKNRMCDQSNFGPPVGALSSTSSMAADGGGAAVDCMDVMENFGYMDLVDPNEIWDPSSIFYDDQNPDEFQQVLDDHESSRQDQPPYYGGHSNSNEVVQEEVGGGGSGGRLDELGAMFFEWLKSNKEYISAEDMRNIKLKRSTVECASKRLGSTKEGKKQLLKLILEWVQQYQLQKKGISGGEDAALVAAAITTTTTQYPYQFYQTPPPFQNPNPNPSFNCSSSFPTSDPQTPGFSPSPWNPPVPPFSPYVTDPVAAAPPPLFSYNSGLNCHTPYNPVSSDNQYQVLDSAKSWNPSQVTTMGVPYNNPFSNVGNNYAAPSVLPIPLPAGYLDQYSYPQVYNGANCSGDQRLVRLGSSATKEARKKRMARQRRYYTHHSRHQNNHSLNHNHANVDENCMNKGQANSPRNCCYWPPSAATNAAVSPAAQMEAPPLVDAPLPAWGNHGQVQHSQKQAASEKRQGWKPEKNLKFLLQKVLKQSDVGNLGRIVLPKKEAEAHLPELETRDGILLAMEDIGTSRVWNMRYRFWPNNKSRMYLLENTGDFVKANGLQEGDFIVIYCDIKCGKYLIRGVKVRQPGTKTERKKPTKRNQRNATQAGNGSPSSPGTKPTEK